MCVCMCVRVCVYVYVCECMYVQVYPARRAPDQSCVPAAANSALRRSQTLQWLLTRRSKSDSHPKMNTQYKSTISAGVLAQCLPAP